MKVLIVDDNDENLYMLDSLLKGNGYEVTSAHNGIEALDRLSEGTFNLIVSDILMPKMDGFQLCRAIRSDDKLKETPFVFYSATYTDQKDIDLGISLGANCFLVKPLDPDVLLDALKYVLEGGSAETSTGVNPLGEEMEYFRQYNEVLFRKLEKKMLDLERVNKALEAEVREHKRTAEALRESEAFRSRVFDSSRVPIVVMDGETFKYIDCNQAAADIYRFVSISDTLGRTPLDVSAPVQYDGTPSEEKARIYIDKALTDGFAVFEWRQQRPDGEQWDAEVHLMSFRSGDRQLLQFTLQDISKRKHAEEQIMRSLEEKSLLLREIHHRVKNNMAIIAAILKQETRRTGDPGVKSILNDTLNRLMSMSLIHEQLYKSNDFSNIEFSDYLNLLATNLRQFFSKFSPVSVSVEAENIMLGIDTAIPLGMIINELLMNSFEHAFAGRPDGEIRVSMTRNADGNKFVLAVRDNGIGLPDDIDINNPKTFGMTIINATVTQIGGTAEVIRSNGTEIKITANISRMDRLDGVVDIVSSA